MDRREARSVAENPLVKWSIAILALIGLVVYFYPRTPIPLDDHGYDASVALYRICNQKDEGSLNQVALQIADWQTANEISEKSFTALQSVVELAEAGDWNEASRRCRLMMEDQVQR